MIDLVVDKFINKIECIREKIESIYFFGSRTRGDEKPDSDYDILLVVNDDFTLADKSKLYDAVIDILLEISRLISLKIFKGKEFKKLCDMKTPFTQNILKEGIKVG